MRRAQLLLSLALVQAQYYHQHHMPRAKFDDQTGAPLNDAARAILARGMWCWWYWAWTSARLRRSCARCIGAWLLALWTRVDLLAIRAMISRSLRAVWLPRHAGSRFPSVLHDASSSGRRRASPARLPRVARYPPGHRGTLREYGTLICSFLVPPLDARDTQST